MCTHLSRPANELARKAVLTICDSAVHVLFLCFPDVSRPHASTAIYVVLQERVLVPKQVHKYVPSTHQRASLTRLSETPPIALDRHVFIEKGVRNLTVVTSFSSDNNPPTHLPTLSLKKLSFPPWGFLINSLLSEPCTSYRSDNGQPLGAVARQVMY